jgi:hypothetical protein
MEDPMRGRLQPAIAIIAATLLIAAVPRRVLAAPIIDNDVDIEWSQVGGEACDAFGLCRTDITIIGAPRVVEDASNAGGTVFFDITVVSPQLFNGMRLHLAVGDTSFEELTDANGDPLLLDRVLTGQMEFEAFFGPAVNGVATRWITLGEFDNFAALPVGTDIVFSIFGSFAGSLRAVSPDGPPPYDATIVVSSAGTPVPEQRHCCCCSPEWEWLSGRGDFTGSRFHRLTRQGERHGSRA